MSKMDQMENAWTNPCYRSELELDTGTKYFCNARPYGHTIDSMTLNLKEH